MKGLKLALGVFVIANTALAAAPYKYTTCSTKQIRTPQNTNSYYWNQDCNGIFVLPPVKNIMKVDSMHLNVNADQCKSIDFLTSSYVKKINNIRRIK